MRIIGGEHRGRKIKQPEFITVRPTKDRIREAVFSMIASVVPGSTVLDMFAGSGAYGLEALSRGAEKAVFIEKDPGCGAIIAENIQLLNTKPRTKIITQDAFISLESLSEDKYLFDIVFSDPPYNKDMAKKTLIKINQYDILKPAGLLIVEHQGTENIPDVEGNVSIFKQKTYGNIHISVYKRK